MKGLNKESFFFFGDNCKDLEIYPNSLGHAYLAILNNDLDTAYKVFSNIDSPRGRWGKSLITILKGFMNIFPTYFEIRNFFEIDLDFLLKNNKIYYVELCLGALEALSVVNQEVYKFTARVMLENHFYSAAIKYMDKSKQIYYKDPELHFMYAKYYYGVNKFNEASFYTNECLKLLPDYYPALLMQKRIDENSF